MNNGGYKVNETQGILSRKNSVKIAAVFVFVGLLFAPTLLKLVRVWSTREDYSHGFFVVPIAIYMAWQMRKRLMNLPSNHQWAGLPLLLLGAISYVVSLITNFHTLNYLSMIIVLFSLILFLGGWNLTKGLMLPVLFLLFMFPIPEAYYVLITNPLKLMITWISTQLISLLGIPVYREGNLLLLASTQLEVAEACSGVRSLYSYLMLGCLFAFMSKKKRSKALLLIATIPLAILVNIIRVFGTGVLANYFGPKVAQGFFHEFAGIIIFILGFVCLFLFFYLLESRKPIS